jgi:acyl-[acyl-carrier-protein]-phospholipid O-acyltransferase/long-chain-fatty-acid--[acyl-carrier-protein] ligase
VSVAAGSGGGQELSLVGAIFVAPFLLFSGYAGSLPTSSASAPSSSSPSRSRSSRWRSASSDSPLGHLEPHYGVLFLMATHSTFFSPAKYGLLPEVRPERDLSRVNRPASR